MTAVSSSRDGRYPTDGGSAGTAGARYRCPPAEHPYAPDAVEPGRSPRCVHCGQTRHEVGV